MKAAMQNDVTLAWIGVVGLIGVALVSGVFAIITKFIEKPKDKGEDDQPDAVVGLAFHFDPVKELIQEKDERLEDARKEIDSLRSSLNEAYRERNLYLKQLYLAGLLPKDEWVHPDTLDVRELSETKEEA